MIPVSGKLCIQTRRWQDKAGQDRYVIESFASEMKVLGRRRSDDDALEAGHGKRTGNG